MERIRRTFRGAENHKARFGRGHSPGAPGYSGGDLRGVGKRRRNVNRNDGVDIGRTAQDFHGPLVLERRRARGHIEWIVRFESSALGQEVMKSIDSHFVQGWKFKSLSLATI